VAVAGPADPRRHFLKCTNASDDNPAMSLAAMRDDVWSDVADVTRSGIATRHVLFVDADSETFESLSDALPADGPKWRMRRVASGDEALALLQVDPADVVITDEQLPGMDGVTLLTRVRDKHPTTIRMILSGSAASTRPSLAAIVAHRTLAKPCNTLELGMMIRRSCELHRANGEAGAYRKTMAAAALPSRPGFYAELNRVLSHPEWQPDQVSAVVERDVAMSAKVLQLANSALLGLANTVASVRDAVVYLGADTVRSLALTAEAFGKLVPQSVEGFSFDDFQSHAMLVARITAGMLPAGRTQQEAVTAALLHDIGKLVQISDGGARWVTLNQLAIARRAPLHVVEKERDGITHADVGAHLLSLWGLPDGISEAVAHHHTAGYLESLTLDPVAAVHIANALANELRPRSELLAPSAALDAEVIARLGLQPRLELWRRMARQLAQSPR
jgi:putative nucleotidyltransferase with HDIG domain